jgi:hypothetical protein
MPTESIDEGQVPHIGPAHHVGRSLFWLFSGAGLAALLAGYLGYEHHTKVGAAQRLDRFEDVYTRRCDDMAFNTGTTNLRRKLYFGSPLLQRTVDQQLTALERGASCEEVYSALRDVDFPINQLPAVQTMRFETP